MSLKICQIGDIKLEIVSMVTGRNGYITIIAKPSMSIVQSERPESFQRTMQSPSEIVITDKLISTIQYFIDKRKEQFPNFQVVKNAKVEHCLIEINRLLKKGYSEDIIIECIKIGVNHEFWMRNLMTLTQVNKKCKDELTKFEHLLMIYEDRNKGRQSKVSDDLGPAYEEL